MHDVPPASLVPADRLCAAPVEQLSIGQYLVRRLYEYGLRDVFGIPGDYVLQFYSLLCESPLRVVGCCREDNAGFAADAYARVHGLGCVCVTYCVGGLSLANSVAGAFAEKSPVVVISGAPGLCERPHNPLLHHKVRDFRTQLEVFERLCAAATELNDPQTAFREIDRVLETAYRVKRPVYIELPRDMVRVVPGQPHAPRPLAPAQSDPDALAEAVAEAARALGQAQRPVILAGVEIHRFGLQDELVALAEHAGIPLTATMLGKSVVSETHPLYAGLYAGPLGHEQVTRLVEGSDCLLMLGTFLTDINLGIYTAQLDPTRCIYATSEQLRIRHHHFHDVQLGDFLRGLTAAQPRPAAVPSFAQWKQQTPAFQLQATAPLTIGRMIARLNESLDDRTVVISDVGDALFASLELTTRNRTEFIAPAYYTSMGFAVPAALGAGVAREDVRTVVLVGDGAFQMTGNELSTIIRQRLNCTVIVLDNGGYGTERFLHPGPYNDIARWQYHLLPAVYGGRKGVEVRTEGEFDAALREAWDWPGLNLIQVHLREDDVSTVLRRLADRLSKRV